MTIRRIKHFRSIFRGQVSLDDVPAPDRQFRGKLYFFSLTFVSPLAQNYIEPIQNQYRFLYLITTTQAPPQGLLKSRLGHCERTEAITDVTEMASGLRPSQRLCNNSRDPKIGLLMVLMGILRHFHVFESCIITAGT